MIKITSLLLSALILQGCATSLTPQQHISLPDKFHIVPLDSPDRVDILDWWQKLQSPGLVSLIESATIHSPDISRARVALKNYEAQVVASRARNIPSLSGLGTTSKSNNLLATNQNASGGLQTSWELDLFGVNALNVRSGDAMVESAKAQIYQAHTVIAAEVARSYFNYSYCTQYLDILQKDYDSRVVQDKLTRTNVDAGFDSRSSVFLSEAALAQTQVNMVEQKAKCASEIKALVALTGVDEPQVEKIVSRTSIPKENIWIIPPSIPAQLIEKRPDIYASYRNIEAKALAVGAARGKHYPSVSFSGNLLATRVSTGNIQTSGSTWSIGPLSITLPILDGGVIKANEALALESYHSAQKEFYSTLRIAIKEIETSYITLAAAKEKSQFNMVAIDGYQKSLDASLIRYNAGISSLYELEDSRRAYYSVLNSSVATQNARTNAWIDLYKAMGGGFIAQ